jgi:hypothetical protein
LAAKLRLQWGCDGLNIYCQVTKNDPLGFYYSIVARNSTQAEKGRTVPYKNTLTPSMYQQNYVHAKHILEKNLESYQRQGIIR